MQKTRKFLAIALISLVLGVSAIAGEIPQPGSSSGSQAPPVVNGEIPQPGLLPVIAGLLNAMSFLF